MKLKRLEEIPNGLKQEITTLSLKIGDRIELVKENDEIDLRLRQEFTGCIYQCYYGINFDVQNYVIWTVVL